MSKACLDRRQNILNASTSVGSCFQSLLLASFLIYDFSRSLHRFDGAIEPQSTPSIAPLSTRPKTLLLATVLYYAAIRRACLLDALNKGVINADRRIWSWKSSLSCCEHCDDRLFWKPTSNTIPTATPRHTPDHRSTTHHREANTVRYVAKALPHSLSRHPCHNPPSQLPACTRSNMRQSSGHRRLPLPASTQRDVLGRDCLEGWLWPLPYYRERVRPFETPLALWCGEQLADVPAVDVVHGCVCPFDGIQSWIA